jgi:hypothetical protein
MIEVQPYNITYLYTLFKILLPLPRWKKYYLNAKNNMVNMNFYYINATYFKGVEPIH